MESTKILRVSAKNHKRLKEYAKKNGYKLIGLVDKLLNEKLNEISLDKQVKDN